MIDKETLLKKIENGETVWQLLYFVKPQHEIKEIKLDGSYFIKSKSIGDCLMKLVNELKDSVGVISNLFETKEEAEWELEFGNITRTEKLELPTWKEVQNGKRYCFDDKYHTHNYMFGKSYLIKNCIIVGINGSADNKFDCNYDGYINACRLCKKLFLEGAE